MIVRPWNLFKRFCEFYLKTHTPNPNHWANFRDNYAAYFQAYEGSKLARPDERLRFYPVLGEATATTEIDLYYFYQNAWAARMVAETQPANVVDIGSSTSFVSVLSQFVPTTFFDIRPIEVNLPGLSARAGSILDMPLGPGTAEFITSICVIEHIGLGRYGDPIHPDGQWLAAMELDRVLAPGGKLALSLTAGPDCVAYNAHRIFKKERFLELFPRYGLANEALFTPHPSPMEALAEVEPGEFAVYATLLIKPVDAGPLECLGLPKAVTEALLDLTEGRFTLIGRCLQPLAKRLADAGATGAVIDFDVLMRGVLESCAPLPGWGYEVREADLARPFQLDPADPAPVFLAGPPLSPTAQPRMDPALNREWLSTLVLEATARHDRTCLIDAAAWQAGLPGINLPGYFTELAQAVYQTHEVKNAPGIVIFLPRQGG
ncbi:protein of unknown function, DUF268 [Desulfomicrobium norvegicum]|uniref:DUF268 domain-containing protein n=1 Tax=Desulfomicrobium norvegicum (strain DSM 1741 / NCIMB 8310) TaxID=52561 RepID=A0A8G2FFL5_DESNO|nr:DUF268 domain-containing protein [Desulfomicrobium norvegicum]SFM08165.1 protein of unknown function, DUF268 [Desulfomicrobium norvegicum]